MTDRELLELAAKAAGIKILHYNLETDWPCIAYESAYEFTLWNPLEADHDALRLAVKLSMTGLRIGTNAAWVEDFQGSFFAYKASDPYAATRRCIVRAAAETGASL